ncbi:MAG: NPCBM/NEW2 domain-containing protein, partial [Planctomycetes bacterium]|nr:NPCBM/NEW2 domain-containing protein [Planctomycetota bacterium]
YRVAQSIFDRSVRTVVIPNNGEKMMWYGVQVHDTEGLKSPASHPLPLLATAMPPLPDVYLSDVPRIAEQEGAWGGKAKKDTGITGNPVSIRSLKFEKGIGMHAPASITVQHKEKWKRFVAVIGIDDKARDPASVHFLIKGDEKVLYQSVLVKRDMDGIPVNVIIPETVKKLTFIVTDGGDGAHYDHGDWAQAGFMNK